ncbi:MAG: urea carboxylase [Vulcanimicrobiaceae bacterium]
MFSTILIANRGEIAARIVATTQRLGIASVVVASEPDRFAAPALAATRTIALRGETAAETYLDVDAIVAAARASGADAVHPGYGFLSENAAFAERLASEGIAFVGPRPEHLRAFGLKHTARELAVRAGLPLLPGSDLLADIAAALEEAARVGYPVMLKSTAGGGGIGMAICASADDVRAKFAAVSRAGQGSFGDGRVYLERYVARARHIEVQIFGDGRGGVVALGERDCTLQRRHQKVVEETPAPNLPAATRDALQAAALRLARSVAYESAGTVEFVYDAATDDFFFLEVNTRLQVEHGVTEAIYDVDLVAWMIRQAAGEFALPEPGTLRPRGHAIEARVYAEDPARGNRPSAGRLTEVRFPSDVRVDTWIATGTDVTTLYDPLLAKIIATGATRDAALDALRDALAASAIWGIETNLAHLGTIVQAPDVRAATMTTGTLATLAAPSASVEVVAPGAHATLQARPGRLGYWHVGVPPSGPMDARSFRIVNRLVGNREETCALEMTLAGATLRFAAASEIAFGGARMTATLDGVALEPWRAIAVAAGGVLAFGAIVGPGNRTYLAVRGGFDAPQYLGSRATFALGGFGGHATGVLKTGDVLRVASAASATTTSHDGSARVAAYDPLPDLPTLTDDWEIGVVDGPHGAPDFFTADDIAALYATRYEVHFNSARTGVRLIGPKPAWARTNGGEAGLHPSNVHDTAYAIGALDFTGDVPIVLGPDGPSLGGFVCPATVVAAERWKLGQLRPGDTVRFVPHGARTPAVVATHAAIAAADVDVTYRAAGDENLLVEYGAMVLDVGLRLRVQLLLEAVVAARIAGVVDLTPGIRSLQIHFDRRVLGRARLIEILQRIERDLPAIEDARVPSRIVHLPLSWDDDAARLAMRKYQELVRPNAPWCPSNIEFIRRINGLATVDDVRRTVFDASYLVLGLGDVYLGAPVATPLDPRHRLVTTKYNPARTWTPENAVGIGGAYLCIYGMEGPGGYQLVGRTIQVWNSWRSTPAFAPGSPWLLRFFDRIRFFPVSPEELLAAREAFPHGAYPLQIEESTFDYREYRAFLDDHADDIARFRTTQRAAFEAERVDWVRRGLDTYVAEDVVGVREDGGETFASGSTGVGSPVPGNVWKILITPGRSVARGEPLVVLESMKMEIEIVAPAAGTVVEIRCVAGKPVAAGQTVVVLAA